MILDIEGKEINEGDIVICTIGNAACQKVKIKKFTEKGIHYFYWRKADNTFAAISWYMHKSSIAAKAMYKI